MEWMTQAACKGRVGLFFPAANERPGARVAREQVASAMCRVCPVATQCAALGANEEFGMWAGQVKVGA